jgi:hypothetical protein
VTDANADRVAGGDLLVHVRHDRPEPAGGVPAGQGGSRLHPAGTGAQDKHRADPATSTGSRPSYTGGSSTTAPGRRSDGDGARMFSPHPWPSKFAARQIGPICAWSSGNVARVTAEHNGGYLRARAATLITGSYTYGLRVVERRPVPTLPRSAPAMAMVQTMMLALASMCQLIRSALGSPRGRDSGGSRRPAPSWSPRARTKGRRPGYVETLAPATLPSCSSRAG